MWEDPAWQGPERVITQELTEGEKLLWAGQPRQGVVLRGSDAFFIPFSILWGGFAIFWEALAIASGVWFMMLWGIPFVLIGIHLIVGRFWVDAGQRAKTFYGVSTERIVIISGVFTRQVKSLSLRTLTDVSLTEKSDGSGTISLGAANAMLAMFQGMSWPGASRLMCPSFEMIENAREVYEVIRQAQRADQQTPA